MTMGIMDKAGLIWALSIYGLCILAVFSETAEKALIVVLLLTVMAVFVIGGISLAMGLIELLLK